MLFAAEGGGFFSSSASGYSSGLTLLLLGRKNEERPMRVSPWNQYQLVEQDLEPDVQLASSKGQVSQRCVSFICFGRVSTGIDGDSLPKVGPANQTDLKIDTSVDEEKILGSINTEEKIGEKTCLKSSLRKNPSIRPHEVLGDPDARIANDEENTNAPVYVDRRKVQWTDACGMELVEIREFEVRNLLHLVGLAHWNASWFRIPNIDGEATDDFLKITDQQADGSPSPAPGFNLSRKVPGWLFPQWLLLQWSLILGIFPKEVRRRYWINKILGHSMVDQTRFGWGIYDYHSHFAFFAHGFPWETCRSRGGENIAPP